MPPFSASTKEHHHEKRIHHRHALHVPRTGRHLGFRGRLDIQGLHGQGPDGHGEILHGQERQPQGRHGHEQGRNDQGRQVLHGSNGQGRHVQGQNEQVSAPYSTNVLDFLNNFYGLFW